MTRYKEAEATVRRKKKEKKNNKWKRHAHYLTDIQEGLKVRKTAGFLIPEIRKKINSLDSISRGIE